MLPSGTQALFTNRVAWAITHMTPAGLLARPAYSRSTEETLRPECFRWRLSLTTCCERADFFRYESPEETLTCGLVSSGVVPQYIPPSLGRADSNPLVSIHEPGELDQTFLGIDPA